MITWLRVKTKRVQAQSVRAASQVIMGDDPLASRRIRAASCRRLDERQDLAYRRTALLSRPDGSGEPSYVLPFALRCLRHRLGRGTLGVLLKLQEAHAFGPWLHVGG